MADKEYKIRSVHRDGKFATIEWVVWDTTVTPGVDEFGEPCDIVTRTGLTVMPQIRMPEAANDRAVRQRLRAEVKKLYGNIIAKEDTNE